MSFSNSMVCRSCSCGRDYYGGRSSVSCPACSGAAAAKLKLRINTTQMAMLRNAGGVLGCLGKDRCSGKALVARGFAIESPLGFFFITPAGRERSRFKADLIKFRDDDTFDLSLLQDLPKGAQHT